MAIDPLKIARAIRAAQATKKKIAKVPRGEAREIARESSKRIGSSTALKRSGGTIGTRPTKVPKDLSVKKVTPPPGKRSIYQEKINKEIFNVGLDNFQIKYLAFLVREEFQSPVEIDIAPDDADKRDYNVVFKKIENHIGFRASITVPEGVKEIHEALKSGKIDTGRKTITVQWYKNIIEAKKLLETIELNGRVI